MIWGFILKRAWTHGRSELLLWLSMFYDPFLFSFSAWLDFHLTMWTRIRITRNIQTTSQHDEICQILIVISSDFDFCEHFENTHSILPHITFSLSVHQMDSKINCINDEPTRVESHLKNLSTRLYHLFDIALSQKIFQNLDEQQPMLFLLVFLKHTHFSLVPRSTLHNRSRPKIFSSHWLSTRRLLTPPLWGGEREPAKRVKSEEETKRKKS